MSETLKPCPFCGGEPRKGMTDDCGGWFIQCHRCMATTALHYDRAENLVLDWNRRAFDEAALSRARAEGKEHAARIAENFGDYKLARDIAAAIRASEPVVRDPTPPHRRSALEHERDAGENG